MREMKRVWPPLVGVRLRPIHSLNMEASRYKPWTDNVDLAILTISISKCYLLKILCICSLNSYLQTAGHIFY